MDTLFNLAFGVYITSIPFALVVAIRDDLKERRKKTITARDLATWLCVAFMPILNSFIMGLTLAQLLDKLVIWENR